MQQTESSINMQEIVLDLPTWSAKIRALDDAGFARADIARFLGKRYQHVRNVLEQRRAKTNAQTSDQTRDVSGFALRIEPNGRLLIPVEMRRAMGVEEGAVVTARVENGELRVLTVEAGIRNIQKILRRYIPEGAAVVDEFLAERRQMWGED